MRTVLFSTRLPCLLLWGVHGGPASLRGPAAVPEPGGPLDAGARLVALVGPAGSPRAVVRLDLLSRETDAEASVMGPGGPGPGPSRLLARTWLKKGRATSLLMETQVTPGRENHLFFRVRGRGTDGSVTGVTVYLRVNLDESLEPRAVGEYLQYRGGAVAEGRP